jgi:hypothetical protein
MSNNKDLVLSDVDLKIDNINSPRPIRDIKETNSPDQADIIADRVMIEVKLLIGDIGISSGTLAIVIRYTMEVIEKTPLKGTEQMNMALRIIDDLIDELPYSTEKDFLRQTLDNGGVKNTIELVVQATKGEINVNKVVETTASNCLVPCISYFISKCKKKNT